MKKLFSLLLLLNFSTISFSQTREVKHAPYVSTKLDTVTTLCLVLTNVQSGQSQTMWLVKVYGNIYDFPTPSNSELRKDSLTLKKQLIPVKIYYTNIEQEVVDPKTKKKVKQQQTKQIPQDLILIDFNNDYPRKNGR